MLTAMIRIQWKGCRHLVTALAVAAFGLPIASVAAGWHASATSLPRFLSELELWGLLYPGLAAVAALALGTAIWASDRRGHHVYALLLPVARWRYVLLRFAAGLVLLVPVILALWAGAVAATAAIDLPPGLRIFPHALTVKFGLALLLLFSACFAAAAASGRTLGIAVRLLGLFLAVHVAVILLRPGVNLVWMLVSALASWPGPFAPLGGRWMLIDV